MIEDRRRRIDALALAAEALPAERRAPFLRRACGADRELRLEVESLLAHLDAPLPFLEAGAFVPPFAIDEHELLKSDPMLGRRIGAYRIEALVGAGGMGSVYSASRQDGLLQHQVAIKVLDRRHAVDAARARFQAEWQTLARLGHSNIARLLDAGHTDDGIPYLVMEFVGGSPIDEYCDRHRLSVEERLRLFQIVARTVHFAHQNLVVHRDLKPANILVTADGVPKLLDFGIAKVLERGTESSAPLTVEWSRALTPDYASPEQVRGDPISTASDVYPLGVVLYELLTGRRPHRFDTGHFEELQRLVSDEAPPRPSEAVERREPNVALARRTTARRLERQLRGDLDNIVSRALCKDPRRRYASAAELADDLQRYFEGRPVSARPDTAAYRLVKFARRNRLAVGAAAALVLALAMGAATTAWQARRATEQAALADAAARRAGQEAARAQTEARSAQQMTDFLVDSLLVSAPRRQPEELAAMRGTIERQASMVRRQYAGRPHLRANLLDALGRASLACSLHDLARVLIEEAAAVREAGSGTSGLDYARSLGSLGELAFAEGEYALAAKHFGEALARHRAQPSGVHRDIAQAANNLGVALRRLGRLDEAERLHEEALQLRREEGEDGLRLVAESLNNLGAILLERGQYERAIETQREVLAIRRRALGDRDPLVAQALSNLGTVLCRSGDFESALPYLEEAVEIYRALHGADPKGLARTLNVVARARGALGQIESAQTAAKQALATLRSLLGPDHPDVAASLLACARLEAARGRPGAATALAAEAVAIYRASYPAGHERIGRALDEHGSYLLARGDAPRAEPLLQEAHRILVAERTADSRVAVATAINLGRCLRILGRLAEAEQVLRDALQGLASRESDAQARETVQDELCACHDEGWKDGLAREGR